MAVRIWGAGSTTTTNLGLLTNWSADTLPVNGDTVIFDGEHGNIVPASGWATFAAVSPAKVIVADEYTGSLGATATRIEFLDCPLFLYSGQGTAAWFQFNGTCTVADILDSGTGTDALHLSGGTITLLQIFKGKVTLDAGVTAPDIYVHYKANQFTDSSLTVVAAAFLSRVYQRGGTVTCASAVADIVKTAGTWTHTTGDIVTLANFGGSFDWTPDAGTIGRADIIGGRLDSTGDAQARTITDLYVWYGAEADLRNGAGNIVVTNPVQNLGGRIYADPGSTITYA